MQLWTAERSHIQPPPRRPDALRAQPASAARWTVRAGCGSEPTSHAAPATRTHLDPHPHPQAALRCVRPAERSESGRSFPLPRLHSCWRRQSRRQRSTAPAPAALGSLPAATAMQCCRQQLQLEVAVQLETPLPLLLLLLPYSPPTHVGRPSPRLQMSVPLPQGPSPSLLGGAHEAAAAPAEQRGWA